MTGAVGAEHDDSPLDVGVLLELELDQGMEDEAADLFAASEYAELLVPPGDGEVHDDDVALPHWEGLVREPPEIADD